MRRYQTRLNGGIVLVDERKTELAEHVGRAIAEARAGRQAWIRSRDTDLKRQDDLSRFYRIEFRVVDGAVRVTSYETCYAIDPYSDMSPDWIRSVATLARRIINPELIPGGSPP